MKIPKYPTVPAGVKSYHMKISKPASINKSAKIFVRFGVPSSEGLFFALILTC